MTQPPIPMESLAEGLRAPEAMRAAIRRALEKSPDARFQTVTEFKDALTAQGTYGTRPQMTSVPEAQRTRTEVGEPIDAGPGYGPGPMMGPPQPTPGPPMMMGGGPPVAPMYTPAAGNVAYPTPAGIPQAPPREQGGGGGRTAILIIAGLIAVASVVAIVFAVRGTTSGAAVQFQPTSQPTTTPPATTMTPTTPVVETASPTGAVPPLNTGANTHPGPGPGPGPHPTTQPPPPKYDGPECQRARQLKQLGHAKEAERWVLACMARGGTP